MRYIRDVLAEGYRSAFTMLVGVHTVHRHIVLRSPFTDVRLAMRDGIPIGEMQLLVEPFADRTSYEIGTMAGAGSEAVFEGVLRAGSEQFSGTIAHVMKKSVAVSWNVDDFVGTAVMD